MSINEIPEDLFDYFPLVLGMTCRRFREKINIYNRFVVIKGSPLVKYIDYKKLKKVDVTELKSYELSILFQKIKPKVLAVEFDYDFDKCGVIHIKNCEIISKKCKYSQYTTGIFKNLIKKSQKLRVTKFCLRGGEDELLSELIKTKRLIFDKLFLYSSYKKNIENVFTYAGIKTITLTKLEQEIVDKVLDYLLSSPSTELIINSVGSKSCDTTNLLKKCGNKISIHDYLLNSMTKIWNRSAAPDYKIMIDAVKSGRITVIHNNPKIMGVDKKTEEKNKDFDEYLSSENSEESQETEDSSEDDIE